jgi:hypothetical protein
MDPELQRGIERLTQIFESGRILKLSPPEQIRGRMAFYFVARAYSHEWLFSLSYETLSDLPATKTYSAGADRFARSLANRFKNKSPEMFFCVSGVPVVVQIQWPLEAYSGRAASYMRVDVTDIRDKRIALCFVVVTHLQSSFDLKEDPFLLQEGIVNSIRMAIDQGLIKFYPQEKHPKELQQVELVLKAPVPATPDSIDKFIRQKVVWLAFRAGDATTAVWIADPWDASYLGTPAVELKRSSQVLDARAEVKLDGTGEFATIGRELLARLREFEGEEQRKKSEVQRAEDDSWDVFVSHASEDKDSFVRPLAAALAKRGLRVWFDEYTLRLGDSLTRSIDKGLASCRFGIVVLSPAFFSKEWTQ